MEKLSFAKEFGGSVDQVWNALTTEEMLEKWLMPGKFLAKVGFRFHLEEPGLKVGGEVLEVVENKRLSYLWISQREEDEGQAGVPSIVTWTLTPIKTGGTRLEMEHQLIEAPKPVVLIEAAVNWSYAIHSSLFAVLNAPRSRPVPIVYVSEEISTNDVSDRRAGFRQLVEVGS